jgi:hypothetical protein
MSGFNIGDKIFNRFWRFIGVKFNADFAVISGEYNGHEDILLMK